MSDPDSNRNGDGNAKSHRDGMPEADSGSVYIV
jgi:hypothetical protein